MTEETVIVLEHFRDRFLAGAERAMYQAPNVSSRLQRCVWHLDRVLAYIRVVPHDALAIGRVAHGALRAHKQCFPNWDDPRFWGLVSELEGLSWGAAERIRDSRRRLSIVLGKAL